MTVNHNRYEKYDGEERNVSLPAYVDGQALKIIGSKAFLSCKTVEKLVLPETVEVVEDWGFAHMKNLREIEFPVKAILFGKQVFLGCDSLEKVALRPEWGYEGITYFLASMFCYFPQDRLEDLLLAGDYDGQWRWLKNYDDALEIFLKQSDDNGFVPAFIGWFDVADVDDQKQDYMLHQRKVKIKLSFQRLLYGEALADGLRKMLEEMIAAHPMLVRELFCEPGSRYGRNIRYYKIWREIGGLTRQLAKKMLTIVPEEVPEIRAYLMEILMDGEDGGSDFFAELEL